MGWRILYIDEGEYLSLHLDNIKITDRQKDRTLTIPIKDVHTLIVDNYRTVLSAHLINALTDNNVNVVLCDVAHMPQSLITPVTGNKKMPYMLRKQLNWNSAIKKRIQQSMVRAKLDNQIELLSYLDIAEKAVLKLKSFKNEILPGDKTNREGLAAKVYFRAVFGSAFKRFDDDVLNAGLNYGYSILRSQISKTVIAKGMTPMLGFFHHGPNNAFNLSDDFLEVFRPLVDFYVYQNLRYETLFRKEHKLALIKNTLCKVYFRDVRQTFFNALNQYVDSVVQFADTGNMDKLSHPVIDFNAI